MDYLFSHPANSLTIPWLAQSGFIVNHIVPHLLDVEPCTCAVYVRWRKYKTLSWSVLRSLAYVGVLRQLTPEEEEDFVARMCHLCYSRYWCGNYMTPVQGVFDMLDSLYQKPGPRDIWLNKARLAKAVYHGYMH